MDKYSYILFKEAKEKKDLFLMETVYDINFNDNNVRFEYARLLADNKFYNKAEIILLDLLNNGSYKDHNLALMGLGKLETRRKNYKLAKDYYLELKNSSNRKDVIISTFELGKIAELEKNYEEALKYFEETIELNYKDDSYSLFEKGRCKFYLKDYDSAEKIFKSLAANGKFNDHNLALYELARISMVKENYEEAKSILKKLYKTNDNRAKAMSISTLGKLESVLGNYDYAKEYFLELLDCEKTSDEIYAFKLLFILEIKEKNYEEVLFYINKARKNHFSIGIKEALYVCKKLNVFLKDDFLALPHYSYIEEQIFNYDPYYAIDNISVINENSNNKFNPNLDLYILFNDIKKYLTEDNKIKRFAFLDYYLIYYPNVGLNKEDYLLVETLPNSLEIINFYPADNNMHDDYGEILPLNKSKVRVKK